MKRVGIMQEYIDDYLNYILLEKRLSNNTYESYKFDLECFNNFFKNKNINNIKENDVVKYLEYLATYRYGVEHNYHPDWIILLNINQLIKCCWCLI